jgi:ornithine carbamoyltransferase
MYFEKASTRTRVSFETGMCQLGGHAIYLTQDDIGLGTREPVQDVARVLGRMCDGIMARTFRHDLVRDLARFAPVPVINGLTDASHPCQAMADLMTVKEAFGDLAGRRVAFVGDGNNVARSLAELCGRVGMPFGLCAPPGYRLDETWQEAHRAACPEAAFGVLDDPPAAVADADVVVTDTWVSMGQEAQKQQRLRDFDGYQVDAALLAGAPPHVIVLHCLPAYRGYEIAEDVLERHAETIFREAENRLHFQRTLLHVLLAEGGP